MLSQTPKLYTFQKLAYRVLKLTKRFDFLGSKIFNLRLELAFHETKLQELKTQGTNNADPLFIPENIKSLSNRNVIIYSQDVQSKFLMNTFSYFSHNFLNVLS